MKFLLLIALFNVLVLAANAQDGEPKATVRNGIKDTLIVDAACGQCRLGLAGDDCNLAIRIGGKAYFVDGTDIDAHGDAHAKDGFCNAVRKAKVQGEIVNNRFKATYFQLLPQTTAKGK